MKRNITLIIGFILFISLFVLGFRFIWASFDYAENDYKQLVESILNEAEPNEYGTTAIDTPDFEFTVHSFFIKYLSIGGILSLFGMGGVVATYYILVKKIILNNSSSLKQKDFNEEAI